MWRLTLPEGKERKAPPPGFRGGAFAFLEWAGRKD